MLNNQIAILAKTKKNIDWTLVGVTCWHFFPFFPKQNSLEFGSDVKRSHFFFFFSNDNWLEFYAKTFYLFVTPFVIIILIIIIIITGSNQLKGL